LKTTYCILEHIASRKRIKEFANFLALKALYSNSCIYNTKRLPKLLNVSRTKANRLISIIIKEEWGHFHNGHLILKSAKEIHKNITNFDAKNFIEVHSKEDIYYLLLKNKLNRKEYIKTKINDLNSYSSKTVKAAMKKLKLGESDFVSNGTSLQSIAKNFNLSKSHTGNMLNVLKKLGFIKIERVRTCFGDYNPHLFNYLNETHTGLYVARGLILKNRPSKITCLSSNNIQ